MKIISPQSVVSSILFFCFTCILVNAAIAQTNTWDGSSDANWNTPANWSLNHVPLATEDVVIPNGITGTITINTAAVCLSFTMNGGNTANTVSVSGTNSLTVTNGVSIGGGTGTGDNKLLAINGGTLSCGSVTMATTGNDNRVTSLTISAGAATVTGSITMNDTDIDRNIVSITGTGTLNVGGSITGGNLLTVTGSTVNYNGAGQTVRAVNYNGNVTLTGSGTVTLQTGTTSIAGNFTLGGTVNVTAVTGLNIGGATTLGTGTTFTAGSFTHNVSGNWVNNGGTFNGTGSTINFNGTTQSIGGSASTTFNNLTLAGSGTKTFNTATITTGTLSIISGVMVNLGTSTLHAANTLLLTSAGQNVGTWGGVGSGASNINSTFFEAANGILTVAVKAATTYYSRQTGDWNSSNTWSTVTYGNATNAGTFPVAGDVVNIGGGDFTITVNVISACSSLSYQNNAPDSPTVTFGSGITLSVSGAITIPRADNTLPDVNTLAVGAGILNAGSIAFTNGGGGQRHVLTISTGTVTVSGDITESGSNGSATITFTGAGLLQVGGAFLNSTNCTFTPGTGTVEYNGASQTIGDFTYNNLTLSGSGTKGLTNVNTINGNFVMSGTAGATATENIDFNGSVTLGSGTSFTAGSFSHTIAGNWANNGATFTGTSSTMNFDGGGQTIGGTSSTTFGFLTLSGSGVKVFGAATFINATLSVGASVTVNLGTITTHTARTLMLNNAPQVSGTWGGTTSGATNISPFFTTATGIITVSNRIYYTRQTGNWDTNTTWSTVTYANATNTGSFPVAGDIVNVGGGSFTITVNVNSACAFITYQSNATASPTVSVSSGITLDVSNTITIPRANNNVPDVNTLAVGAGILNAGSIAFTNGGGGQRHVLTIGTGTATIAGDISQSGSTGSATITFTGSGLLRVGGTFLNSATGTFTPSTGTVEYNGTVTQTIGDFTYYNLTLNNTAATLPQLTLTGNTTATNTLTMTSGIVNLNGSTFSLGSTGTASFLTRTASTTTNWMYGGTFLRFWISGTAVTGASGNFYGLFPVGAGKASSYRPVAINSTVSPTGNGTFRVTHTDATSNTDLSPTFNDGGVSIVRKHNAQFVNATSVTGGTYDITVTMTGLSAGTSSDIRLAVSNGATTVTTVGTHAAATGTASNPTAVRTALSIANLVGDFRITTANAVATPLPIELTSFTGKVIGHEVELAWKTESELNNDFFTIERSSSVEGFTSLGKVMGQGTTSQRSTYTFTDIYPLNGRAYYRLKQTDFDGTFSYSAIILVTYDGPVTQTLQVYPNPSTGTQLTVELSGVRDQQIIPVAIYDQLGKEISKFLLKVDGNAGHLRYEHTFNQPLNNGVYIIKAGQSADLLKRLIVTNSN